MARKRAEFKEKDGLVETTDPENDKPVFRKPGFNGIEDFAEMDRRIAAFLRKERDDTGTTREVVARYLGLSTPVFGRYEKAVSKLNVTRLVHLSEVLGFDPMELVYAAAPHLFGKSPQEAEDRMKLAKLIWRLPHSTVNTLVSLVDEMHAISAVGKPEAEKPNAVPEKEGV